MRFREAFEQNFEEQLREWVYVGDEDREGLNQCVVHELNKGFNY